MRANVQKEETNQFCFDFSQFFRSPANKVESDNLNFLDLNRPYEKTKFDEELLPSSFFETVPQRP